MEEKKGSQSGPSVFFSLLLSAECGSAFDEEFGSEYLALEIRSVQFPR